MRSDAERLKDILEAIGRIEKYVNQGRQSFEHEELIQVWIVHNIEIIGEAARALSEQFITEHPEIPWPEIISTRNILIHNYFAIDLDEVWSIVTQDLPELKRSIEGFLRDLA